MTHENSNGCHISYGTLVYCTLLDCTQKEASDDSRTEVKYYFCSKTAQSKDTLKYTLKSDVWQTIRGLSFCLFGRLMLRDPI